MKFIIFTLVLLGHQIVSSQENTSHDFGRSTGKLSSLSTEDLARRMFISGEILIFNLAGDRLLNFANERRRWDFNGQIEKPMISHWSYKQNELPEVALSHEWSIQKDGKIEVKYKLFDSLKKEAGKAVETGKLLKEEQLVVPLFRSIEIEIPSTKFKVIVKLTPNLGSVDEAVEVANLPIATKNLVIHNSQGQVWAYGVEGNSPSKYFGVTTHLGTLMLSFSPFKDAVVIGEAQSSTIRLSSGQHQIFLQNGIPFLPGSIKAKIYGRLLVHRKSEHLNSVRTYTSNLETDFLNSMK